ncbi:MAG: hypothetical protein WKF58_18615 [Ilumatobacteraceae bacterium]
MIVAISRIVVAGTPVLDSGELRRVLGVVVEQRLSDLAELQRAIRVQLGEERLPVDPAAHELALPRVVLDEQASNCEQQHGLGTRPRRQPEVGLGARVGQPGIDADHRRAALLALDDPLRVRVEVVAGLEVRRDQEDHLGVGEVARRPVVTHPRLVADAGVGRADVGVAVVPVDAPRLEHAVGVTVLSGSTDVVHHLVVAILGDRRADAAADLVEGLVPRDALPPAAAALADALQRVQDPLGIVHLVEGRRALGAVAATAGGMLGVALDLGDLAALLIDVGDEPARRLAVEARRRHEAVRALLALRPRLGVELVPVVPLLVRREVAKCRHRRTCCVPGHATCRCGW